MASRLLGRYARLLCRASSQAPAATAARLPPSVAGVLEVQRGQGWPCITERLMCEGRAAAKDTFSAMPVRTQLEELVEKAVVPEDILKAWAEYGGNGNQAANAMTKWTRLVLMKKDTSKAQIMDPRLQDIMNTISQQVRKPDT